MANRYFVPALPAAGACTLAGEVAHHLARVLRCRPGDRVRLGDGQGGTAEAVVQTVARDAVHCQVERVDHEPRHRVQLVLAFAVPRLPRLEWILEHGTEVGVAAFRPLWTARTRPQGERAERWQRIVSGAAGQCDRAWLPAVLAAGELTDFLAACREAPRRFVGAAGAASLRCEPAADGDVVWLVGPEGGFTTDEQAAIHAAGFAPRSCGAHTLRTETAAVVGAAMLLAP